MILSGLWSTENYDTSYGSMSYRFGDADDNAEFETCMVLLLT